MPPGKKYGGRKKGTPNKVSTSVKIALETAFIQLGDVEALVRWGKRHRCEFYRLWAKMLPKEMNVKMDLDDSLSVAVRDKINEVDGEPIGQPSETRSDDSPSLGDAAAPAVNQQASAEDGGGQT